jgi:hypothetical protein
LRTWPARKGRHFRRLSIRTVVCAAASPKGAGDLPFMRKWIMAKKKKLSKSDAAGKFYQDSIRTVPVDVWKACVIAYQAAARLTMPVKNPGEYKVRMGGQVYAFTDNPLNRGMMAVKEFLREEQMEFFPAIVTRIMAFSGVMERIQTEERFAVFFKPAEEEGATMISEALLDAFATAQFMPRTMDVDLDAVHSIATTLLAQEK